MRKFRITMDILLPQIKISFPTFAEMPTTMLVSGGRAPNPIWLNEAAIQKAIFCADHGIDACQAASIEPDYLIGDDDSMSADGCSYLQSFSLEKIKLPVAKDLTDTQAALQLIAQRCPHTAILATGIWGGRFDHLFSTLFSLAHQPAPLLVGADESECIFFLRDGQSASFELLNKPLALSLLPFSPVCTAVNFENVRWPLYEATLEQKFPYAVSNLPVHGITQAKISLGTGLLGVYICQKTIQRRA